MDFENIKSITIPEGEVASITVNGVVLWQAITFTNLVPTSIDTDGSIFNGVGYKENVRLSSSGGVSSSAQNGSVTTGFMPWKSKGIVKIKGARFDTALTGHYYINIYDTNKKFMYAFSLGEITGATGAGYHIILSKDEASGVTTIDFSGCPDGTGDVASAIIKGAFFRINAYGKGADLIVTVNEEIEL